MLPFRPFCRRLTPLVMALFLSQSLVSCVTPGTAKLVKTQVMDDGLERKVLKQTGLSGAVGGFLVGAGAGILLASVQIALEEQRLGRKLTDRERAVYVAQAAAMAMAGGIFGWHKGREKGAKVVATANDRDKLAQLVKGAKNYNAHIDNYNSVLRNETALAKVANDKSRLRGLSKEASYKMKTVDKTIADRTKSINNLPPNYRSDYKATLAPLIRERDELQSAIQNIAAAEKSIQL